MSCNVIEFVSSDRFWWNLGVFYKYNVMLSTNSVLLGFPGGSDGKQFACSAGDPGSVLGLGRSPGGGNGSPCSVLA